MFRVLVVNFTEMYPADNLYNLPTKETEWN